MLYPQYFIDDLKNRSGLERIFQLYVKRKRITFSFGVFLSFVFVFTCYSQDKPEALLVDSVGKTSCEDYMARSDNFGLQLEKYPNSRGVLVWYDDGKETEKRADRLARFMHRALINRFSNDLKVTVLRSTAKSELSADMWIVPNGVELVVPHSRIVAEIPFKVTKRTLYAESGPDPCSNYDHYGFARVLLSNPDLNGIIVDVSVAPSNRREDAANILNLFREASAPRDRLRIFFKRPKRHLRPDFGYLEMWLVPRKKR